MNRTQIITRLLVALHADRYLEIGLGDCVNFFEIPCYRKYGVDPAPMPRLAVARTTAHARIFQKTSDAFFAEDAPELFKDGLSLAFIDGLHEHDQAYRDVLHSLAHIGDNGVVVMHDCNPLSKEAAAVPRQQAKWNGDVWKAIVRLRTHCDLRVVVLDTDEGIGIVMKGTPETTLSYTPEEIRALSYDDLARNRSHLLNLKSEEYLATIVEQVWR